MFDEDESIWRQYRVLWMILIVLVLIVGAIWRWQAKTDIGAVAAQCLSQNPLDNDDPTAPLLHAKNMGACMGRELGPLQRWMTKDVRHMIAGLPNAPCKYVGRWRLERKAAVYFINLRENGSFRVEPANPMTGENPSEGAWGYADEHLIWFYPGKFVWPPDANAVLAQAPDALVIEERDGSHSALTFLGPIETTNCTARSLPVKRGA